MTPNPTNIGAKSRGPSFDAAFVARRVVVLIAAGAGLFGILAERPIVSVAWRAATVALLGLGAIHVAERATGSFRFKSTRRPSGGAQ